ncbi:MAG: SHOCT domain-containing protein [Bacteroidales bacterium]|jgi:hypothetical protein
MKNLLSLFFITLSLAGFSQSFVFCPVITTTIKKGLDDIDVSIVFKDSRVYEAKLKENCTKSSIYSEFVSCFNQTFQNVKLNVLDESKFGETAVKGSITIYIDIKDYEAIFSRIQYVAKTKFDARIVDRIGRDSTLQEIFSGEAIGKNKGFSVGFKSAMVASNMSFQEAFDKFVLFMDKYARNTGLQKNVKQIQTQQNNSTQSKADRLRELKKLLDDGILTQAEFDKEKKKILDDDK